MLGLFGTLSLANRSLQAHRQAAEVTGHNLANVNNPAYARQRVVIQTAPTVRDLELGQQGTGVDAVAIVQIRSTLLDRQIQAETSVRGSLDARKDALDLAQAGIGQQINRGATVGSTVGEQRALADNLSEFFNGFQSLASSPTSTSERQVLLIKSQDLTTQFHEIAGRLSDLNSSLNQELGTHVDQANAYLDGIAQLNAEISRSEFAGRSPANDLRDARQEKIEALSKLIRIETTEQSDGTVSVSVGGTELVRGQQVADTLELYSAGDGRRLLRTHQGGADIDPTGGSIHGTLEVRDGELAAQRSDLDLLASQIAAQVNAIHAPGYSLTGSTGANFFTGTTAATLEVNASLVANSSLIQTSALPDATGNNKVALAIAQLANKRLDTLGNQTFLERYNQSVSRLGQAISSTEDEIADQDIVDRMLTSQRESVSGVSIDEEMTDLIRFQKAFEASAKLLTTVDEMLETVMSLKR
jgi:flagellar hook-associated protein 1 FlgK